MSLRILNLLVDLAHASTLSKHGPFPTYLWPKVVPRDSDFHALVCFIELTKSFKVAYCLPQLPKKIICISIRKISPESRQTAFLYICLVNMFEWLHDLQKFFHSTPKRLLVRTWSLRQTTNLCLPWHHRLLSYWGNSAPTSRDLRPIPFDNFLAS